MKPGFEKRKGRWGADRVREKENPRSGLTEGEGTPFLGLSPSESGVAPNIQ